MSTKKKISEGRRIITPVFRVSYPHVFKPAGMRNAHPDQYKYSIVMLFPKNQDITLIKKALHLAKVDEYGTDKSRWPQNLELCLRDGDSNKFAGKEGYSGHYAVTAKSELDSRPKIVDKDPNIEITSPSDFYPGCYARASIFSYCWEFGSRKGVSFSLDSVQKIKDGESFSSKKSAAETFGPLDVEDFEEDEGSLDDDEMNF